MQDSFSGNEQHPYEYEEQWEEEEESQQQQQEENDDYQESQESPKANSTDNKKNTNYTYQAQKIIINDLEDNESPTYMDFFENGQKRIQTMPNDTEELENKKTQPRRWEILYERAKGSKQAKEELRKEYKTDKLDPECTFRPKLLSANNNRLLYTNEPEEGGHGLSIHERNKLWKSRVETKLLETRETFKDHDMVGCTFKPNIAKSQTKEYATKGLTSYGSKGIDLYLRRRIIANQYREEKEKILENPLTKLPPHVYKKGGNITIPKGPDFSKGKTHEIHSLKKPLEFPKPTDRLWTNENESPERAVSPQKKSQILVNPIHVGNLKFGDAIQKLHHELHRMNIN